VDGREGAKPRRGYSQSSHRWIKGGEASEVVFTDFKVVLGGGKGMGPGGISKQAWVECAELGLPRKKRTSGPLY